MTKTRARFADDDSDDENDDTEPFDEASPLTATLNPDFARAVERGLGRAIRTLLDDPRPEQTRILRDAIVGEDGTFRDFREYAVYLTDAICASPDCDSLVSSVADALADPDAPLARLAEIARLCLERELDSDGRLDAAFERFAARQLCSARATTPDDSWPDWFDGLSAWTRHNGASAWNRVLEAASPSVENERTRWELLDIYDERVEMVGPIGARRDALSAGARLTLRQALIDRRAARKAFRAERAARRLLRVSGLAEVLDLLTSKKKPSPGVLRDAVRELDDDSFERLAWLQTGMADPEGLSRWLACFADRAFPGDPTRVRHLLFHADERVSWRALVVLAKIDGPVENLRETVFALAEMGAGFPHRESLAELLVHNRGMGDDAARCDGLVETLARETLAGGSSLAHDASYGLFDYAKANHDAPLDAVIAEYMIVTDCARCRETGVDWLIGRGTIPDELLAECFWDAGGDVRKLARAEIARRAGRLALSG